MYVCHMGWLRLVGSLKLWVTFAKEPYKRDYILQKRPMIYFSIYVCDTAQSYLRFETATHCNTLQHTATHCDTLRHTTTHCDTLRHTATHCDTLQHTAAHCDTMRHTATHCDTLRHTAPHCGTLQHTATLSYVRLVLQHFRTCDLFAVVDKTTSFAHIYTHLCVYTYMCATCIYIHVCVCVCVRIWFCVCVRLYVHVCVCVFIYTCARHRFARPPLPQKASELVFEEETDSNVWDWGGVVGGRGPKVMVRFPAEHDVFCSFNRQVKLGVYILVSLCPSCFLSFLCVSLCLSLFFCLSLYTCVCLCMRNMHIYIYIYIYVHIYTYIYI